MYQLESYLRNMRIAPNYKTVLDKLHKTIEIGFPMSCVGMYDCGVDHIFGLLKEQNLNHKKHIFIPLYIENTMSCSKIEALLLSELKKRLSEKASLKTTVWETLSYYTQNTSVVLIFYIGYKAKINLAFAKKLLASRFQIGKKLNWILFGTYGIFHQMKHEVQEKMLSSCVITILPHTAHSLQAVFSDYRDWYGKIAGKLEKSIIQLSGGNPGLLKSLYLLALSNKLDKWMSDKSLLARLSRIAEELSLHQRHILLMMNEKPTNAHKDVLKDLELYGYIQNNKIFSPLLRQYLFLTAVESTIVLSQSQKSIFSLLKTTSGLVSRENIAGALWGDRIQIKYSDWAIDQAIYALRKTLKQHSTGFSIQTKRNQGYALTSTLH